MTAFALVELASVAAGIRAGDAMVKNSPVRDFYAGTIYPGRYLIYLGGPLADVEEAFQAGLDASGGSLLDALLLPDPDPRLHPAIGGKRRAGAGPGEALGIIETHTAAAAVDAAERGLKGAGVDLRELRLAERLGGRAFCVFQGTVADVEEAVDLGVAGMPRPDFLLDHVVIAQIHEEMRENLDTASEFFEIFPTS